MSRALWEQEVPYSPSPEGGNPARHLSQAGFHTAVPGLTWPGLAGRTGTTSRQHSHSRLKGEGRKAAVLDQLSFPHYDPNPLSVPTRPELPPQLSSSCCQLWEGGGETRGLEGPYRYPTLFSPGKRLCALCTFCLQPPWPLVASACHCPWGQGKESLSE